MLLSALHQNSASNFAMDNGYSYRSLPTDAPRDIKMQHYLSMVHVGYKLDGKILFQPLLCTILEMESFRLGSFNERRTTTNV